MVWGRLSIARKLYLVVGVMAVLIAGELATLRFSMTKLSAVRAFVGGEGTWSKSQKNAAQSLQLYALNHDENDYLDYLNYLRVPEGDHIARLELSKPNPDLARVRAGFLQGQIHPDDIDPMVDLLREFSWVSYLHRAINAWVAADGLLDEFKSAGSAYHAAWLVSPPDHAAAARELVRVHRINEDLTAEEEEFSSALGAGSRWMERVVISLLSLAVLMVETIGLTLTVKTTRRISRGLAELNGAAARIGHGDFSQLGKGWETASSQRDEIASLADALTEMGHMLEKSYLELESRVQSRTAELTAMAEENVHLYNKTKDALATRDEFLSVASHELKTPLSALLLQLQLAERVAASPRADTSNVNRAELLHKAVLRGKHLARLIDELLDLSRIRAGKIEMAPKPGDLREVAADALSEIVAGAEHEGSKITFIAPEPVRGSFDTLRMGQVVTNLVSNAIKYGGGKPIVVSLHEHNGSAELTVRDHGVGIALGKQKQIFERFERAGMVPGISGLGLGLYVVRQIVVAHGGEVTVESQPGQGALFTVRVPLVAATQAGMSTPDRGKSAKI